MPSQSADQQQVDLEDGVLSPLDFIKTLAAGFFPLGGPQVLTRTSRWLSMTWPI